MSIKIIDIEEIVTLGMAEDLTILKGADKDAAYTSLIPQIQGLIHGESNLIANMANITAALKEQFGWLWVGFYIIEGNELVLGPFQGPVACTRISKGKGVCGSSWSQNEVLIVPDVEEFPGHIACSSASKSEIVLPFKVGNELFGVLDVDSVDLNTFDKTDQKYLLQILELLND